MKNIIGLGIYSFGISLIILVIACSSGETIIKARKVEITIPKIEDSIKAEYKDISAEITKAIDSLFQKVPEEARIEGEKEIMTAKGKTKAKVKYYPKKKFFELDIEEHKVDTIISDTTMITEKKEVTTTEKLGYAAKGIIIFLVIVLIIIVVVKFNITGKIL